MMRSWLHLITVLVIGGCQARADSTEADREQVPIVVGSTSSTTSSTTGGGASPQGATLRIGTWNLHNFSKYGIAEYRIDDIAAHISSLDADVLGVQELKVTEDTSGEPPQAWDSLLDQLAAYDGLHNPWRTFDTSVGLLYKRSTTTVLSSRPLFEDDSYAFPRPPFEAELEITKGGVTHDLTVIVLHLKAFQDSVARRRAACEKLDDYLSNQVDAQVVLLGDLNDDPYDAPADNAFVGTFLDAAPKYHFVTDVLPPESVTSLGYFHTVDGMRIDGEFLDHFIVTGGLADRMIQMTPTIVSVPESERDAYESSHSDHFPVMLELDAQ